jgi:hypothetical protein
MADTIDERVRKRLAVASMALDRRSSAARPRGRKRSRTPDSTGAPSEAELARENASLRMVFRELGDAHRRYRTRTGEAGTPALRAAARAFKSEPSFGSLVPVAAFLDELGILAW